MFGIVCDTEPRIPLVKTHNHDGQGAERAGKNLSTAHGDPPPPRAVVAAPALGVVQGAQPRAIVATRSNRETAKGLDRTG